LTQENGYDINNVVWVPYHFAWFMMAAFLGTVKGNFSHRVKQFLIYNSMILHFKGLYDL